MEQPIVKPSACRMCQAKDQRIAALQREIESLTAALEAIRKWNSKEFDSVVVFAVHSWIDGGMQGRVPWPDSPFFAEWAAERGFVNESGFIGRAS